MTQDSEDKGGGLWSLLTAWSCLRVAKIAPSSHSPATHNGRDNVELETFMPNSDGKQKEEANQVHEAKRLEAPWCNTLRRGGEDSDVQYLTVNVQRKGQNVDTINPYNVHLVRFYMENVWKLKRPDVIITISGGAAEFDMSTENKDKVLKGMMAGTRSLDAWFITGGTSSGIMKYVGEARAKYNPDAPLIGICSLGCLNGGEALRGIDMAKIPDLTQDAKSKDSKKMWQKFGYDHPCIPILGAEWQHYKEWTEDTCVDLKTELAATESKLDKSRNSGSAENPKLLEASQKFLKQQLEEIKKKIQKDEESVDTWRKFFDEYALENGFENWDDFVHLQQESERQRKARGIASVNLDQNHSHFIFAEDGGLNFGAETQFRADLESCLAGNFTGVGASQPGCGGKILQRSVECTETLPCVCLECETKKCMKHLRPLSTCTYMNGCFSESFHVLNERMRLSINTCMTASTISSYRG